MTQNVWAGLFLIGVVFMSLTIGLFKRSRQDDLAELFNRKGDLIGVKVLEETSLSGNRLETSFQVMSSTGLVVNCTMVRPTSAGRYPVLFLVGGLETGRETVSYLGEVRNTVLISLDYPYKGKKKALGVLEFFLAVPRIRQALLNTPAAIVLCLDYLLAWQQSFTVQSITLVGGSLGALFTPVVMALDKRVSAAVIIFGAADLSNLLKVNMQLNGYPFPIPQLSSGLASVLLAPLEPARYLGASRGRPLLMVNGAGDPRMPRDNVLKLYLAAGKPKDLLWLDIGHVEIGNEKFGRQVGSLVSTWLKEHHFLSEIPPHFESANGSGDSEEPDTSE